MAITQEVRDYAAGLSDNEKKALFPGTPTSDSAGADASATADNSVEQIIKEGMEEKSAEFRERGGEIYLAEES